MTFFSAFVLSFGAMLALMALIAAWLFRTSGAPFPLKIAVPSLIVALACFAPLTVNALLGFPVEVSFGELPERSELVAFVAQDEAGLVDLWLRNTDDRRREPRAYEVELTPQMKSALRKAQGDMGRGLAAVLTRARRGGQGPGQTGGHDALGLGDDTDWVLDERTLNPLPPKE